jgi:hypothetical protein
MQTATFHPNDIDIALVIVLISSVNDSLLRGRFTTAVRAVPVG